MDTPDGGDAGPFEALAHTLRPNEDRTEMNDFPNRLDTWHDLRDEMRESFRLLNQRFDALASGHSLHGQHIAVLQAQHATVMASQTQCRVDCQNMQRFASDRIDEVKGDLAKLSVGQAITKTQLAGAAGLAGWFGGVVLFVLGKMWP